MLVLATLGCVSTISAVAIHSLVALTYAGDTNDDGRRFLLVCAALASLMMCAEAGYRLVHPAYGEPSNDGVKG